MKKLVLAALLVGSVFHGQAIAAHECVQHGSRPPVRPGECRAHEEVCEATAADCAIDIPPILEEILQALETE